ncbi:hypothetical protein SRABI128_05848 [Microbacterium sp. Bi128]|nr:hypothetical protein SRABI128_05848 [Microbacterium sp. Bi128]
MASSMPLNSRSMNRPSLYPSTNRKDSGANEKNTTAHQAARGFVTVRRSRNITQVAPRPAARLISTAAGCHPSPVAPESVRTRNGKTGRNAQLLGRMSPETFIGSDMGYPCAAIWP